MKLSYFLWCRHDNFLAMNDTITGLWHEHTDALAEAMKGILSRDRLKAALVPFKHQDFATAMAADARLQCLSHDEMLAAFTGVVNDRVQALHSAPAASDLPQGVVRLPRIDLNGISAEEIAAKHAFFKEKGAQVLQPNTNTVAALKNQVAERAAQESGARLKPGNRIHKASIEHETMHQVGLATSLLVGAVSLYGAYNNFSQLQKTDDQGKKHIDGTNLAFGIVNLALVAANAAFAVHSAKALGHLR